MTLLDDERQQMCRRFRLPSDYVGEYVIPTSGKTIWWTGKVAIGLRYQSRRQDAIGSSSIWIQDVLLNRASGLAA